MDSFGSGEDDFAQSNYRRAETHEKAEGEGESSAASTVADLRAIRQVSGLRVTGSRWQGADSSQAHFTGFSLQGRNETGRKRYHQTDMDRPL